jgi:acetyl esterase
VPLHPFVAAMLAKQKEAGAPALSAATPADARALVAAGRAALGPGPDMAQRRDLVVPTRSGTIPARLLVPHGSVAGLVVYAHGGGWVVGTIDDYEILGRELAARSGCAVLLPDYRLAPENPFPAGLHDVEDTLLWAASTDLAGPGAPIVVAGDSAGANLATVATRRLWGQIAPVLQVLSYPVTDADTDSPSYREFAEGLPLTRADMQWFYGHYAPEDIRATADVSPLRADDLSGMPPAVVVTAEYDVLRSEGEAYAEALSAAGAKVTTRRYAGVAHGFLRLHNHLDTAREAVLDIAAAVAEAARTAHRTQ